MCIVYGLAEDEPFSPFLHISVQHGKPRQMENQDRWKTKTDGKPKQRRVRRHAVFYFHIFFQKCMVDEAMGQIEDFGHDARLP